MKTLMTALLMICLLGVFEPLAAQDLFDDADANGNEVLVYSEVTAVLPAITRATFDKVDQNADGILDYDEFELGYVKGFLRRQRPRGLMSQPDDGNNSAPGS